jgi:hypothetical protein
MGDEVVSYEITLHSAKWIDDRNGRRALLAYSDEFPDKQFLILAEEREEGKS